MVQLAWENTKVKSYKPCGIWHKLRGIKPVIKQWHHWECNMDPFEINQLEEDIDKLEAKLQLGSIAEDKRKEIMEKKVVLWFLYKAEERSWQQKSIVK